MARNFNYDKFPVIPVTTSRNGCEVGWAAILERIRASIASGVVCVECYPGASVECIDRAFSDGLQPSRVIRAHSLRKPAAEIGQMLERHLGNDPVFGRMNDAAIRDFFDPLALARAEESVRKPSEGITLVLGTGAALIAPESALLIYADMARWEIQRRQRRGEIGNLGADNPSAPPSEKYKRAFFVDWRAADRLKKEIFGKIDFFLDTNDHLTPKLIGGKMLRDALRSAAHRPFRVVPYFDPGPWGGHWMEEVCDLPADAPNHAWCFDCVPEENSLLFGFGDVRFEVPAIDLVFQHPRELLGEAVHARFGTEFPIRFDFLDTMGGGNLSLQVHPLTEYIQDKFGMNYTQDESYYLLDAGADACVYLGLRESIDSGAMLRDLREAQVGGAPFPTETYVNKWPAKKHDHFLIPAGTIHCSGRNSMVLEISATPYIFTFKLWDWGRLGLNGLPRPIHLDHGAANIQWDRRTAWVRRNLINQVSPMTAGSDWREERTGLHEREFLETRRHWFSGVAPHHTHGGVNVLNLVGGKEVAVESPSRSFAPFIVHYAETFIVPASVGPYTIRPYGESEGKECATIKAFVRTNA
jgi:mannose-6-phosphate isomerase class I